MREHEPTMDGEQQTDVLAAVRPRVLELRVFALDAVVAVAGHGREGNSIRKSFERRD